MIKDHSILDNPFQPELRLSVTQACNYACSFCHAEGFQPNKKSILSAEDYQFLYGVGKEHLNWETVTVTGGEPLVRKDIVQILEAFYLSGGRTTVVTNGFLLGSVPVIGRYVDRINISMHTRNPEIYERMVGRQGSFEKASHSIERFRESNPETKLRINATVVDGLNSKEEDILELLAYARKICASVKFIELFPPNDPSAVPLWLVEDMLLKNGFRLKGFSGRSNEFEDGSLSVTTTKIFCAAAAGCGDSLGFCRLNNDLFVSASGKIKPCRFDDYEIDILPDITSRNAIGLADKIKSAVQLRSPCCKDFLDTLNPAPAVPKRSCL